ncbi:MAG: hypothetical protein GY841_08370, partial [FCB group bacterium]|nr:hypothetical protein [FCB group bacterium]
MRTRMLTCVVLVALTLCWGAAFAQDDPFGGGFDISFEFGKLIATMGEQNDTLQGWIFDWSSVDDSIYRVSAEPFADSQDGDDRDFAAGDFNNDGSDDIVMAWSRSDGGIFVGIPNYDLDTMILVDWNTPDPPIAAGVLYATDSLAEVLGEIRVVAGNFYDDEAAEFVLAYLAADSTVSITVFDVDTLSLTPEAMGSISDQAIHTEMPEAQRFGTASRFDIATGDLDNDGTDEIVLIASDPAQSPETDVIVAVYDYDTTAHTISFVSQDSHLANMKASEVSCLRRLAATMGDFDGDDIAEVAFVDDWARSDENTLHYANTHFLDLSSDMMSIERSWDWDSTGWAHLHPKTSLNNDVHCLTEYNGDIIAGGLFTSEYSGTTT